MKRFAGEKSGGGLCTASHRTLMEKLKIGPKALKTSLEYLTEHGWIANVGSRKVMTPGGPQEVQNYRVNDIWKLNVQHYKGANEGIPLVKGGDERKKGADERSKGGDESATTYNYIKHIEQSSELEDEIRTEAVDSEEGSLPKKEKDIQAERAVKYWYGKCKAEIGQVPSGGNPKHLKMIKEARRTLSYPQIKQMMDEWFENETQEPHEMIQITRSLSSFRIDKFLAENV